jgi:hypothetical protein
MSTARDVEVSSSLKGEFVEEPRMQEAFIRHPLRSPTQQQLTMHFTSLPKSEKCHIRTRSFQWDPRLAKHGL